MKVDELLWRAVTRLGVVRVSSALNPLLWLTAPATGASWLCAWLFRDDIVLRYGFSAFGALLVVVYIVHYTRFAMKDPDRVQSEEFLSRKQELSILERKGVSGPERVKSTATDPLTIDAETPNVDLSGEER